MIDAYQIGTNLALSNGVSEGIAVIYRDLAALDQAVASNVGGLTSLAKLAEGLHVYRPDRQVPETFPTALPPVADPPMRSASGIMLEVAPGVAPSVSLRDVPQVPTNLGHAAPSAEPRSATSFDQLLPQFLTPPVQFSAAAPITDKELPFPAAPAMPFSAVRAEPDAPPERDFAQLETITAAPSPPIAVHPTLPTVAPSAKGDDTRLPAAISMAVQPAAIQSEPTPSLPPEPTFTAASVLDQTAARPLLAAVAAAPQRRVPPVEAMAPVVASPVRDTQNGAAPAAARELLEGTILLDGTRMGRWVLDRLTRQAARPTAGTTGIDPRINATFPGAPTGV